MVTVHTNWTLAFFYCYVFNVAWMTCPPMAVLVENIRFRDSIDSIALSCDCVSNSMVGKLSSYLNQRWKIFNRPIIGKKICHYPRISLFLWIQLHFFILWNNVLIVIEVSSENIDFEFNLIGEMRGGRFFHISFNSPLHRIVRTCRGLGPIKLEKSPRERGRERKSLFGRI